MIPKLTPKHTTPKIINNFLTNLDKTSFKGTYTSRYSDRIITSTDNSIYQVIPDAILYPKTHNDIHHIFNLANKRKFKDIHFTPRGGGTGTNGQSINNGIIIDTSKFMRNILKFDKKNQTITVEAGVILDQLNDFLKPHGYHFPPNLSPSNRATIGGMI